MFKNMLWRAAAIVGVFCLAFALYVLTGPELERPARLAGLVEFAVPMALFIGFLASNTLARFGKTEQSRLIAGLLFMAMMQKYMSSPGGYWLNALIGALSAFAMAAAWFCRPKQGAATNFADTLDSAADH